jgi:hypothetical protein
MYFDGFPYVIRDIMLYILCADIWELMFKYTSPNSKNMVTNASLLNDKVEMETENVQAIPEGNQAPKNELSNSNNGSPAMEISPNSVPDNSRLTVSDQMATAFVTVESPDAISKVAASRIVCSLPYISNEILKEAQTLEKAGNNPSMVSVVDVHAYGMDNNGAAPYSAVKSASLNENEVDPIHAYAAKAVTEHPDQNENLVPVNADEMADEGLNEILPDDKDDKKDCQLEVSSGPVILNDSSTPVYPEFSNFFYAKDGTEVSNNAVDSKNNAEQHASSNQGKGNMEECKDSDGNNASESSVAQKLVSVIVLPASDTGDVSNFVENDVEKSSRDQEKVAKKEYEDSVVAKKDHEDAILRRARYIEVYLVSNPLLSHSALFCF